MKPAFTPKFQNFQKDIEDYITSQGDTERTPDGFTIFYGYDDALDLMFRSYLEQGAYEPLVAHFRRWNWEAGDNAFLLTLSEALYEEVAWPGLKTLWESALTKRRGLYNEMRWVEKKQPGSIPPEQVEQAKALLIETLTRLIGYAGDFGQEEEAQKYARNLDRIQRGLNA